MSVYSFDILLEISILAAFLPVILLLINIKSIFSRDGGVLFFLAILWLLIEILNYGFAIYGINTYLNLHIFDTLSTILYLAYFKTIFNSNFERRLLDIIGFVYVLVTVTSIIAMNAYFITVMTNLALTMTIPFILALLAFYRLAKEAKVTNLLAEPKYWINSAILIHFGMSIVGVLISDVMYDNLNLHLYIWPVVIISNIFYNILFSIGAWKMRRT